MEKEQVGETASGYFQSGYNCAEAVLMAVLDAAGVPHGSLVPKVASAFGGGVGGTRKEMCGAISGAVMALGCLKGRMSPDEDIQKTKDLAAELMRRFEGLYSHTHCNQVLDRLGSQVKSDKCNQLVANVAGLLMQIMEESSFQSGS